MDVKEEVVTEAVAAPEPSAIEIMIDAWHRQHFAGMPVEVWNASAVAVADLKAKLAAKP